MQTRESWIVGIGHHLPAWRLISPEGSGRSGFPRAGADEDAITVGVTAAAEALGFAEAEIQSLTFSTARPAYEAKSNAAIVHEALRLPRLCNAFDVGGPARSGIGALTMAALSGATGLVVAADLNYGPPGSAQAKSGSDGAAAFVIVSGEAAEERAVAKILGSTSVTTDVLEHWRLPGEWWTRSWGEDRFAAKLLVETAAEALQAALEQAGLTQDRVSRFAVVGANRRAVAQVRKGLGAGGDALESVVGDTGSAAWALHLIDALEQADENDVIALLCLEDGCEVVLLESRTPPADAATTVRARSQASARQATETDYLIWRGALQGPQSRRPDPTVPSLPGSARDYAWKFGGIRRTAAGTADVAKGHGVIREWVTDYLATSPDPPLVTARVEYDGIDLQLDVVDVDVSEVSVGDEVEGVFRRRWSVEGIHNYVWKVRPRGGRN